MKYNVYLHEDNCITFEIEAENEKEALKRVLDGEGVEIDESTNGFIDQEDYIVVDDNNNQYEVKRPSNVQSNRDSN